MASEVATIAELKRELLGLNDKQLVEICLKLAKGTKQAKEQLNYVLFKSHDLESFISEQKSVIEYSINEVPRSYYFAKKPLRKIIKEISTQIKFAANPRVDIELLIHFLYSCHRAKLNFNSHPVITNMARAQIKKINKAILKLHEDLQYDYNSQLEEVLEGINVTV